MCQFFEQRPEFVTLPRQTLGVALVEIRVSAELEAGHRSRGYSVLSVQPLEALGAGGRPRPTSGVIPGVA